MEFRYVCTDDLSGNLKQLDFYDRASFLTSSQMCYEDNAESNIWRPSGSDAGCWRPRHLFRTATSGTTYHSERPEWYIFSQDEVCFENVVEGTTFDMEYTLPSSLDTCSHVVIQWWWQTSNNCVPATWKRWHQDNSFPCSSSWPRWNLITCDAAAGTKAQSGEQFTNCIDVPLAGGGTQSPTSVPVPTAAPTTPEPTLQPTVQPTVSPTSTPQPTSTSDSCMQVWEQCGGQTWNGATCCEASLSCVVQDQWYSQCKPSETSEPEPNPEPEPEAEPEPEPEPEAEPTPGCAGKWQRCGGHGHTGLSCCADLGFECQYESQWHSQCNPVSLVQEVVRAQRQGAVRKHRFLGASLIQAEVSKSRSKVTDSRSTVEL